MLKPGLYALWTVFRHVKAEIVDARVALFEHEQLATILGLPGSALQLETVTVEPGQDVGRPLGLTPHELGVSAGAHSVVFIHPIKGRRSMRIEAAAGKTALASVSF